MKEKQIEEMAKDMGVSFQLAGTTRFGAVAEALIRFGWIKPSKDSVVLSKEEYEALKKQIEYWEHETKVARQDLFEERKETAEKIYRELQGHGTTYVKKWIKEQFGVEIKE